MNLTSVGVVAIDVVFALAVLAAASCLVYLASLTIREHLILRALRSSARPAVVALAPAVSNVARLADRRADRASRRPARDLRSGVARRGAGASL